MLPPATVTVNPGAPKPAPAGQLVWTFGVPATVTPPGSVSVKAMPDCAGLPVPFASVNVSVDVPDGAMVGGANAFVSVGCDTVTVCVVTPLASPPPVVTCAAPLFFA